MMAHGHRAKVIGNGNREVLARGYHYHSRSATPGVNKTDRREVNRRRRMAWKAAARRMSDGA